MARLDDYKAELIIVREKKIAAYEVYLAATDTVNKLSARESWIAQQIQVLEAQGQTENLKTTEELYPSPELQIDANQVVITKPAIVKEEPVEDGRKIVEL